MIVAEELLKPISEEAPCGEDLSYDASFQALETMVRGKPETQFSAAEPPDWKELSSRCLSVGNLVARGDHRDNLGFAEAMGKNDRAADHLVSMLGVDAKTKCQVDGLVELHVLGLLE